MSAGETKVLKNLTRYIAKDKDNSCYCHRTKPTHFNCECFADLKWLLDDPIEIEILIRGKEKSNEKF